MRQIEVIMLQAMKDRLKASCRKLGTIDVVDCQHPCYVYVYVTTMKTATAVEEFLRKDLGTDGYMEVSEIHEDEYNWPDYTRGDAVW